MFNWQAAKRGLRYPKYTWIIYDWYPERWWESRDTDTLKCSNEEMKTVLERAISFRRHPLPKQDNSTTDAGIVSNLKCLSCSSTLKNLTQLADTKRVSPQVFNESYYGKSYHH